MEGSNTKISIDTYVIVKHNPKIIRNDVRISRGSECQPQTRFENNISHETKEANIQ